MSDKRITTVEYTCDICGAEKISPVSAMHKAVFGYRPIDAFGVEIHAVPFGDNCNHVCGVCATKALKETLNAPDQARREASPASTGSAETEN